MPPRKKAPPPKAEAPKQSRVVRGHVSAPSRAELSDALIEYVKAKMPGRAELVRASDLSLAYITKRLPTGLLDLDIALRGGFPAAGLSQIIGPKNAGKSWFYWQVIRMLQMILGPRTRVLLAMTEMRADRTQARLCGVQIALSDEDIESMERARIANGGVPFTPEERASFKNEVGTILEAHGMSAEDLYDIILRDVEARISHLIVIDSFGSIMSGAEAEAESMHDKTYGGSAGVNTQFLHKLTSMLLMRDKYGRTRDACIIGINQVRDDIKNPNAPYKAAGGKMLEHTKFVDLYVQSGKSLGKEYPLRTPSGTVQRHCMCSKEVNWEIKKGKAGIHEGARGTYQYEFHRHVEAEYGAGIYEINNANFVLDALIAAQKLGVVRIAGSWVDVVDADGNVLAHKQGMPAMVTHLEQDMRDCYAAGTNPLINQIRNACYRIANIEVDYSNWD